jgi:hypothetical protein
MNIATVMISPFLAAEEAPDSGGSEGSGFGLGCVLVASTWPII